MKVSIDGKEFEVEGKKTILEVARENGIFIPSLCDHSRLAPFSGCRLCIVEIKGRRGYPPSCGTCLEEGMEVKTKTPELQKLRREILELILSEHPNACLICSEKKNCDEYKSTIRKVGETTGCVLCPNNGRCELQDVVEALKIDKVRFPSLYRNFEIKKNDPFFDRNYNLCILCGRCVRVCHEVRGASALSFVYRGSQAVVGTVLDRPLLESGCQFCGACLDVCPTGALTERAIKYEALPQEKARTICPLCSIGCELEIELREGRILSSKPSNDGAVNRGQACVKGRFLIKDLVYSPRRILRPLIRANKELEEVGWEEALNFVAQRLEKFEGKETALISSPQASIEEDFLMYKFGRGVLESENIDSCARYSPLATWREMAQAYGLDAELNFKIQDIAAARTLFLIGEEIPVSQPIIWLEVLRAVNGGARLIVASPTELSLNRFSSAWLQIKPGTELYLLAFLSKILLEGGKAEGLSGIKGFNSFKNFLDELDSSKIMEITGVAEEKLKEAASFLGGNQTVFLFGKGLTQHPWGSQSFASLWNLALQTEARLFPLGLENNARGVLEIAWNFSGQGLSFNQIVQAASSGKIKALYLAGPFPELKSSGLDFLVIQDSFSNENLKRADAFLPAATFVETEGTFINIEGRAQKFAKVIKSLGEAKPDWWIVSQLALKMGSKGFDYKTPSEILKEISGALPGFSEISLQKAAKNKEAFVQEERRRERSFIPANSTGSSYERKDDYPFLMLIDYSLDYYRSLSLCQESRGLRKIRDSRWIKLSPPDADMLKLKEGEKIVLESASGRISGIVKLSESLPEGMVEASFLWNDESDFSLASLFSGPHLQSHSLGALPVRITRGE